MSHTTTPHALPPHTVILASAGTGKTHRLTTRYLRLLAIGESPERILATTFTRKAAGEILRKAVSRLAAGAASPEGARELSQQLEAPWLDTRACAALLTNLAGSLDRLSVGTIDSFFGKLASGYALDLGGRRRRIIDEDEDLRLRAKAVSRVMHEGDRAELMDLVRRRSPGVAARSVLTDILDAVGEAYQCYLSTDRAAWTALRVPAPLDAARVAALIGSLRTLPPPLTKAGSPNKRWAGSMEKSVAAAVAGRWEEFVDAGMPAKVVAGEETFHGCPISEEAASVVAPLAAHAAGVLLAPLPERTAATWHMLHRFDRAYRALKEARGVCTFDDVPRLLLEHEAVGGTGAGGSLEEMYYRLDARLHHVLLDEFQDTSVVQWRLLEPLVEEIVSREGDRSLLCVGDVKQSLYAWRHAEPELLQGIPRRWPHVRREDLFQSRRSSQVVIDTVNEVMGNVGSNPAFDGARASSGTRRALERWSGMFHTHTTHMSLPGFCRVAVTGDKSDACSFKDAALRAAGERIRQLHRAAPTRTIGVLFRSRSMIAAMKHELLRGPEPIHASEEGGNPLSDSPAVAAVLSMLTLADHPGNTAAVFHVATSPLGPVVGVQFPGSHAGVCRAAAGVRLRLLAEGFAGVLEDWFRRVAPHCSARDARRMDQLVSLAVRFDARCTEDPTTRASAFVEFARRARVEDPSADPVRLMTMHASKGLEFDAVVLPWLDDPIASRSPGVLEDRDERDPLAPPALVTLAPPRSLVRLSPDLRRLHEQWRSREVLEELCVLYVALTRAVHALEIFVPPCKTGVAETDGSTLSFARVIRGALAPGAAAPGDVLHTHGEANWHTCGAGTHAAQPHTPAARPAPAPTLDLAEASRTRHLQRRSPAGATASGGSGAAWPGLEELAQSPARTRGILFHAWLERIGWLGEGTLGDEELRIVAAPLLLAAHADLDALIHEFRAMLGRAPLRPILSRASYKGAAVELRRELAFSVGSRRTEGAPELVVGRVDRLVVVSDTRGRIERAEIIDFKTDQLVDASPEGVARHAEAYAPQMGEYRRAVAAILGCEANAVAARLVFLSHDAVIEV